MTVSCFRIHYNATCRSSGLSTLQMFNLSCFFVSQFSTVGRWILMTAVQPLVRRKTFQVVCSMQPGPPLVPYPFTLLSLFVFTCTAIGPDGLICQSREFKEWHGCRSTKGVSKGVYFQVVWDLKQDCNFEKTGVFWVHREPSLTDIK